MARSLNHRYNRVEAPAGLQFSKTASCIQVGSVGFLCLVVGRLIEVQALVVKPPVLVIRPVVFKVDFVVFRFSSVVVVVGLLIGYVGAGRGPSALR